MSIKSKQLKFRLNLLVDKNIREKSIILRDEYHINISSLCREAIDNKYKVLTDEK